MPRQWARPGRAARRNYFGRTGDEQTLSGRRRRGARLAGAGCAGLGGQPQPDQRLSGQGDAAEPREAGAGRLRRDRGPPRRRRSRCTAPRRRSPSCGPTASRRASCATRRAARPPSASARGCRRPPAPTTRPTRSGPATTACRGDGKEQYLEQYDRLLRQYPKHHQAAGARDGRTRAATSSRSRSRATPTRTQDGTRPAVLYNALQHAREWLAGETCRRTLEYFVTNYGDNARVTRLVDTRELWFVCIANPDGYEYTFTPGNRLWRKNMADNDGDGVRGEPNDGVDPNRNFATNWGLDDEGSSSDPSVGDLPRHRPGLRARDQGDEEALGPRRLRVPEERPHGRRAAAVAAGLPEVHAHRRQRHLRGARRHRPRLGDPGRRGDVRPRPRRPSSTSPTATRWTTPTTSTASSASRPRAPTRASPASPASSSRTTSTRCRRSSSATVKFSLDLAESAADPEDPESHLGNETKDFYVDAFDDSYGDPQPVQVTAKRSLGTVYLHYRINGGREQKAKTTEFKRRRALLQGARRLLPPPARRRRGHAARRRGHGLVRDRQRQAAVLALHVRGEVRVAPARAGHRRRELLRPGAGPGHRHRGPDYADEVVAALEANGVRADVYDVDANDMTAPHPLGVLSHYDAVVWEKGDDYVTRRPGQPGQTGQARVAIETQLAVRDFLNEGGKLFFTGQHAGRQDAEGYEFRNFGFPEPDESATGRWCGAERQRVGRRLHPAGQRLPAVLPRRLHLRRGRQRPGRGGQPAARSRARAIRSGTACSSSTARTPRTTRSTRRRSR